MRETLAPLTTEKFMSLTNSVLSAGTPLPSLCPRPAETEKEMKTGREGTKRKKKQKREEMFVYYFATIERMGRDVRQSDEEEKKLEEDPLQAGVRFYVHSKRLVLFLVLILIPVTALNQFQYFLGQTRTGQGIHRPSG